MLEKIWMVMLAMGIHTCLQAQSLPPLQSAIHLGYSGEFVFHPGFLIGYERGLASKVKAKKNGRSLRRSWHAEGNLAMMWHPKSGNYSVLEAGINQRTLCSNGMSWQYNVRLGAAFRENAGTTFIEQEDGSLEGFSFAGNTYALLSAGWGWGFDLRVNRDKPWAWYIQPKLSLMFPYNFGVVPFTRLEMGVRYYLRTNSKS